MGCCQELKQCKLGISTCVSRFNHPDWTHSPEVINVSRFGRVDFLTTRGSSLKLLRERNLVSIEDKDRDDVMERLLELGGDKKYLTFDDLNRELPDNVVSPDDIEDVLQKLEGSNIPVADSDERLLEQAARSEERRVRKGRSTK